MANSFHKRESEDMALIEELIFKAKEVQGKINDQELLRSETSDGYIIYQVKDPNGTMKANKQHKVPQHLRETE